MIFRMICFSSYQIHHNQLRTVQENRPNRFCFILTVCPQIKVKVIESSFNWIRLMVITTMAGMKNFG